MKRADDACRRRQEQKKQSRKSFLLSWAEFRCENIVV